MAALLAASTAACLDRDRDIVVEPPLDFEKTYSATTINTDYIYMGVRDRWYGWRADSARIKPFLNRIVAEGKDPGFLDQQASITASPQTLSFNDDRAYLSPPMQAGEYTYSLVQNNDILRLRGLDTLVIPTDRETRPTTFARLGLVIPQYSKTVAAPADADHEYEIHTVPEQYASILSDEMQFPGIIYYVKTSDGWESFGQMNNYLNENIIQSMPAGDTIIVQLIGSNFK
ncbi:hypothetical protein D770_16075 [Flammeovirgaceae bacterium 311]|nr:hypothetical protein D770_16075 [Flammeovirgaceae bacterium 311]